MNDTNKNANTTGAPIESFDEAAWRRTCKAVGKQAHGGSGCSDTVYCCNVHDGIQSRLCHLPEYARPRAIEIAKEEVWYRSAEELDDDARSSEEGGYCIHGIELGCCPAGCGDIDDPFAGHYPDDDDVECGEAPPNAAPEDEGDEDDGSNMRGDATEEPKPVENDENRDPSMTSRGRAVARRLMAWLRAALCQ